MTARRALFLIVFTVLVTPFISFVPASADVNDFVIRDFRADETLTRLDPQGELHIVETIDLTFSDHNHGIIRALPARYKNNSLELHINRVSSASGAPATYTTSNSNDNTVLKIGDANQTVTGDQSYTIDYTLHNVISFYDDHDELYWDVNGDQWDQPFEHVAVTLHQPTTATNARSARCFSGSYGSTSQLCSVQQTGSDLMVATTQSLSAQQTLTYVAAFDKGYFAAPTWRDKAATYLVTALKVAALPLIALIGAGSLWWKRGRDAKGTGIIVPQYDAPAGLKPIDVGTIADFQVDNRDLTATIIDLAIRGYIKIIERKQDHLLRKDTFSYELELTNNDLAGLEPSEVALLEALFSSLTIGTKTDLSASKAKLYKAAEAIRTTTLEQLTKAGYFRNNPSKAGYWGVLGVAGFIIVFFLHSLLGPAVVISMFVAAIIVIAFSYAMPARTSQGVAAYEHSLGLKLYLNVAEKDRLQKLQAPGAAYAANASEPVKTVELFEKLLPYAIVLGVEKGWAGQFDNLYAQAPGWYSGPGNTFSALYVASSLNNGIGAAVTTAFSPPASSNSSGFGGGGFSGGGGGGGGGGGW